MTNAEEPQVLGTCLQSGGTAVMEAALRDYSRQLQLGPRAGSTLVAKQKPSQHGCRVGHCAVLLQGSPGLASTLPQPSPLPAPGQATATQTALTVLKPG